GNTGITVPDSSHATVTFRTANAPIVAAVGTDKGTFQAPLQLDTGKRLVQVLDANLWFAQRDASITGLPRLQPNSKLEPIVDGNPYFARLVADLRSTKGGGAAELAGWAFVKGSLADSTIDWPLIPGADQSPDDTRLISLVNELISGGASLKFLVNQFLQ